MEIECFGERLGLERENDAVLPDAPLDQKRGEQMGRAVC